MPKPSIVNVTQLIIVSKYRLAEKIGPLSSARVRQVLRGIRLVLEPQEVA